MAGAYFETCTAVYVKAAAQMYQAAIHADYETADAAGYLERGKVLENLAHECWPLTSRQSGFLGRLRAVAELNTPEGRAHRDRIVAKLTETWHVIDVRDGERVAGGFTSCADAEAWIEKTDRRGSSEFAAVETVKADA